MQQQMMRNFTSRSNSHPVLATGNLIEGTLGVFAVGMGIYSLFLYGFGASLILSLCYTAAVTVIALMSAYNLM